MAVWNIEYYPSDGQRNSPSDALKQLCTPEEQAGFRMKFRNLGELPSALWNFSWLKPVRGLYQVRQGNFRAYFRLDNKTIVVLHVCRKPGRKASDEDINIAEANWRKYKGR